MPNEPPNGPRQVVAHAEGALARGVQGVALRLAVEARNRRARLYRVDDHAVVDEPQPGDVRGFGEGCGNLRAVAEPVVDDQIAGDVVIELRGAGVQRLLRVGDRRQDFDVEPDRLRGAAGLVGGPGDDHRDGVADEADLAGGERRPGRLSHRPAVAARYVAGRRDGVVSLSVEIRGGVDGDDALHRARLRRIHGPQIAMRMRAADESREELPLEVQIVRVASMPLHEDRILLARHGLAYADRGDGAVASGKARAHRDQPCRTKAQIRRP
jgi:hypothetical protein